MKNRIRGSRSKGLRHNAVAPLASAALVATLIVSFTGAFRVDAGAPPSVGGGGFRGEWAFSGNIHQRADRAATGQFQIVRRAPRFKPTICNYDAFSRMTIVVNKATFDAMGVCRGQDESGRFEVSARNRITIVDNGEPGPGMDKIEVASLDPGGVVIPGGTIEGGNLQVRSEPGPSAAELQLAALRRLQAASGGKAHVRFENGFPRGVIGPVPVQSATTPVEQARMFLYAYKDLYRLSSPDLGLGVRRVVALAGPDDPGEIVTFYQSYKGLPVYGGEIVAWLRAGTLFGTVGALVTSDFRLDTTPAITARQAEEIARADVGSPSAPVVGRTILMVFDPSFVEEADPGPHLAWRVTLRTFDPQRLFVDAHTGEVLSRVFLVKNDYELDLETANNVVDASTTGCYWGTGEDDNIGDEDGIDDDFQNDQDAQNAFVFAKSTYDFYQSKFGRDSYDNDGNELEIFIHAKIVDGNGNVAPNAGYWSGDACGNGEELFEFSDGFVQGDVMTHEFTHGVVDYGSGLISGNLPGALNESLADVFAFLHTGDPVIAEGIPGGAIRDISNPPAFSGCGVTHPDRWSERLVGSCDNGGVHINAGIPNKAGFLLAQGGTHPDTGVPVTGIGNGRMGFLYYVVMLGMPSSADFFAERDSALVAAQLIGSLFPNLAFQSWEICAIKNAFGAVEIGQPDKDCDGVPDLANDQDNDFMLDGQDNCPTVANPGQENLDGDAQGDACDDDDDGDDVPEKTFNNPFGDNCPGVPNPDQTDANFNGIGAACDPEEDGDIDDDGVPDEDDNCPLDYNPPTGRLGAEQLDSDGDGEGDACDPDLDEDGISNDQDNCTSVPNTDQADSDNDLIGDACDECPTDKDSQVAFGYFEDPISGEVTVFPVVPDSDGDGIPDACDEGGIGRGSISIDGSPFRPARGPQPDGRSRTVELAGQAGESVSIPIPVCLGDCPEAPPPDECVSFEFTGLSAEVLASVTDDSGRGVGNVPKIRAGVSPTDRIARFQPRGGHLYYLNFVFSPRFAGENEFTLVQTPCVVGDRSSSPSGLPPPPSSEPAGPR